MALTWRGSLGEAHVARLSLRGVDLYTKFSTGRTDVRLHREAVPPSSGSAMHACITRGVALLLFCGSGVHAQQAPQLQLRTPIRATLPADGPSGGFYHMGVHMRW